MGPGGPAPVHPDYGFSAGTVQCQCHRHGHPAQAARC
jgi:hypothetical protein